MPIKLNVFGRKMLADYSSQGWRLTIVGEEGKNRPADLVVPQEIITVNDLVNYLNDVYHEAASRDQTSVEIIG